MYKPGKCYYNCIAWKYNITTSINLVNVITSTSLTRTRVVTSITHINHGVVLLQVLHI